MHDLIIRNGRIVDGTGAPAFIGDIAIDGDRIVAVGTVDGTAKREIDAKGQLVTPGWVDMHTHYDGQATWDPYLTPSGWHGVTTVVMGNCGVGFAPCRKEDRNWLINVMEGVEDIPGSALSEGIQWDWETFPEYLDALEKRPFALDLAAQVPHSAVRGYVMGADRSEVEQPTEEEIGRMRELVEEALNAGALGFSTSRTPLHRTSQGVLVAGTHATYEELYGIAKALGNAGTGVFECASEHLKVPAELEWMKNVARDTGRPVVFNLSQIDDNPTLWRELMGELAKAKEEGLPLHAQCAGRSIGICMSWQGTAHPFAGYPSWLTVMQEDWSVKEATIHADGFRDKLLAEKPFPLWDFADMITQSFHKMFPLRDGTAYEPEASESVAAIAEREGRTPQEVAFDILMENDGNGMLYFPLFNYSDGNLDVLHEMHSSDLTFMGLSDGGAHVGAICDAGMPTFMLTHWTRDRSRGTIALERIVHRQTQATATFYGMYDRGVLAPGYLADVNVIDYDALQLGRPEVLYDLPAGGRRLLQRATGYQLTVKRGQIIFEGGEPTGQLPGQLVRGEQSAPTTPVALA